MKLGFIGLGRMGAGMAASLVKAGHDVSIYNRSPGRSDPLIKLGAREAASVAGACQGEAVITMLADDDAASDVALGDGRLIVHLPKGAIHLSMSTISVALSKSLAQAHVQAGQRYVAAPVFGRPDMAAAAKLFIVAAGDPAAVDVCQPWLLPSRRWAKPSRSSARRASIGRRTHRRTKPMAPSSLKASLSRLPLPHRSDTRTSALRWPQPRASECRCRWQACCMIDFYAFLPRAETNLIGLPSAGYREKMPVTHHVIRSRS
jgi:hypothetical protein